MLVNMRVVSFCHYLQGPAASQYLADMGADVIKIEPLSGDGMRGKLRQPTLPEGAPRTDFPFHLSNRGKRSLAVDLGDPRSHEPQVALPHGDACTPESLGRVDGLDRADRVRDAGAHH